MTVPSSAVPRFDLVTNGAQTVFPYSFPIFAGSDLVVLFRPTGGDAQTLVLTTDYTVSGAGLPTGGNVTTTGPLSPLPAGILTGLRAVPAIQGSDYRENDNFPAETTEKGLDRPIMVTQQILEQLGRALVLAQSSAFKNLLVPDPASGLFTRWRADLLGLENASIIGLGALGIPVSIANGGTSATTAAAARAALAAAQAFSPVVLTPGATVTIDASLSDYFTLVPAQAFTLANPTNPTNGKRILVRIKQDAVGGRVMTLGAAWRLGGDIPTAVLSTVANKVNYLGAVYDTTDAKWDILAFGPLGF